MRSSAGKEMPNHILVLYFLFGEKSTVILLMLMYVIVWSSRPRASSPGTTNVPSDRETATALFNTTAGLTRASGAVARANDTPVSARISVSFMLFGPTVPDAVGSAPPRYPLVGCASPSVFSLYAGASPGRKAPTKDNQ